jgi:hypothetical protein
LSGTSSDEQPVGRLAYFSHESALREPTRSIIVSLAVAIAAALSITPLNPAVLAGDPLVYWERVQSILELGAPYFEVPFEHLPGSLIPMVVAWIIGGWTNPVAYTWIFGALMAICVGATSLLIERVGDELSTKDVGISWILISAPLLPFALFRTEPWIVLLVVMCLLATLRGRESSARWAGVLGIVSKGWPVILSVAALSQKKPRMFALFWTVAGATGLALWFAPGFRGGRSFSGLHTESVVGGLLALTRVLSGDAIGRIDAAGATYLEASTEMQFLQVTLGVVIGVLALARLNNLDRSSAIALMGALTGAILVGSPLLSPQFLLWLTPFLVLTHVKWIRALGFAATLLTTIYLTALVPGFEGRHWTITVMNVRNVILVIIAAGLAWSVGSARTDSERGIQPIKLEWLPGAVKLVSTLVLAGWSYLAVVHSQDLFHVDHASRVRVALAWMTHSGVRYPPVVDGFQYAGTRFLPLPTELHSALFAVLPDLITAGKILVYFSAIAAAVLALRAMTIRGVPRSLAMGGLALLVTTPAVLFTTLGIRWDALALAFQLAALLLVDRRSAEVANGRLLPLAGAAALCTAALFTKSTALWGSAALLVWLTFRNRRSAVLFLCMASGMSVALFGAYQWLTDGSFWENLTAVSTAGMEGGFSLARALERFVVYNYRKSALALLVMVLVPCALIPVLRTKERPWRDRIASLSVYEWAFLFSTSGTVLLMSDVGVAENHFLDFLTIGVIVFTAALSKEAKRPQRLTNASLAAQYAILLVVCASLPLTVGGDVRAAVEPAPVTEGGLSTRHLAGLVDQNESYLSEDPLIHVLNDDAPIILDSWVFNRLVADGRISDEPLIRQIETGVYQSIVLWNWENAVQHEYLSQPVRDAIVRNYTVCHETQDHVVHRLSRLAEQDC